MTPFLITLLALGFVLFALLIWALSEGTDTRVIYKPDAEHEAVRRETLQAYWHRSEFERPPFKGRERRQDLNKVVSISGSRSGQ